MKPRHRASIVHGDRHKAMEVWIGIGMADMVAATSAVLPVVFSSCLFHPQQVINPYVGFIPMINSLSKSEYRSQSKIPSMQQAEAITIAIATLLAPWIHLQSSKSMQSMHRRNCDKTRCILTIGPYIIQGYISMPIKWYHQPTTP